MKRTYRSFNTHLIATFALLLLTSAQTAQAQFYMDGGEPDFIHRYQLRGAPFTVIYPRISDSLGHEVYQRVLRYAPPSQLGKTYKTSLPIVVRTHTPYSNGMVAWTPARMVLYGMTGGEMAEPTPWLDHLISHEMRHYYQMQALNRRFFRVLHFILGQQSVGLAAAITPKWFFEGDAIYNESRLTPYGRAHSALTYQQYRADLLTGQPLKYDQYINRSFKYHAPNHYHFGSLMVEHGAAVYGPEFWPNVLSRVSRRPHTLFPFHFGIKKQTGLSRRQFFEQAMQHADSIFRKNLLSPLDTMGEQRAKYAVERFPYRDQASQIDYFLAYDLNTLPAFYRITPENGKRKRIYSPRNIVGTVGYDEHYAIWAQRFTSARWAEIEVNDVMLLDLHAGQAQRITEGLNVISPLIEIKRNLLTTITVNPAGEYTLLQIDLNSGDILDSAKLPKSLEMREMANGLYGNETILRSVTAEGTQLLIYNWETHETSQLLPPTLADISGLATNAQGLYFSASYANMRRAFYIPWPSEGDTPQAFAIHLPAYGVEDIYPLNDTTLLYAAFGINGYQIKSARPEPEKLPTNFSQPKTIFQDVNNDEQIDYSSIDYTIPSKKRFHPIAKSINLHSWLPFYIPNSPDIARLHEANLGATLLSQNALGTLSLVGAYFYNKRHSGIITLDYKGMWPHVGFEFMVGGVPRYVQLGDSLKIMGTNISGHLRLSLPIMEAMGIYTWWVTPSIYIGSNNKVTENPITKDTSYFNINLQLGINLSLLRARAARDLYPSLGFTLHGNIRTVPFPLRLIGKTYELGGTLYLPGILPAHSLRLTGHYVTQNPEVYYQIYHFPIHLLSTWKEESLNRGIGFWSANVSYAFPLGYPDWNWGSWVYFKRFWATLFAHHSYIHTNATTGRHVRAIGLEFMTNLHLFRTQYAWELGIKVAYSPFGDKLGSFPANNWSLRGAINLDLPYYSDRERSTVWF